ncbi:MAG: hypothetical protein AAF725_07115 [Acidobacteriota bacterium]
MSIRTPKDRSVLRSAQGPTAASIALPSVRAGLIAIVCLLIASTSSAAVFTVTLANGTSFETRYRPVVAEWDDSLAMIRTDMGNWIAVPKDDIVDVVSQAESTGFGYQLDTTTLFVGWSPNDLIDESAEGEDVTAGGESDRPYFEQDSYYDAPADGSGGFSLEQFVDVPTEGEGIGSIDTGPGTLGGGAGFSGDG